MPHHHAHGAVVQALQHTNKLIILIREAAKKSFFFNGPAIKALITSPRKLYGRRKKRIFFLMARPFQPSPFLNCTAIKKSIFLHLPYNLKIFVPLGCVDQRMGAGGSRQETRSKQRTNRCSTAI